MNVKNTASVLVQSPYLSRCYSPATMFNLNAIVQKAQSLIDSSTANHKQESPPSKAALFRLQFRLPELQSPLHEITAELALSAPSASRSSSQINGEKTRPNDRGNTYVGKLHLSESFLCFSTQNTSFLPQSTLQASSAFTGQTHGAGPAGNGFTIPLCAIRRVERLQTQNALFALAITTWNGSAVSGKQASPASAQKFTVQLAGSRLACERFCDGLKKGLKDGIKEMESMRSVISQCYSEYLLSPERAAKNDPILANATKNMPDAGLGMVFRYPGDAKKLRDRSKMRLWGEYFRGWYVEFADPKTPLMYYRERSERDAD